MFKLADYWIEKLINQPETGMGYYIANLIHRDVRKINQVVIDSGFVTKVRGKTEIYFTVNDIEEILVTHEKWNFDEHLFPYRR
jgi:hypothetical protein